MAVTDDFDRAIRERLSGLYSESARLLELGQADPRGRGAAPRGVVDLEVILGVSRRV
jgi:hypothetical protein